MRGLLRRYRTLRALGVGRIASMWATWRVTLGPEPEGNNWPGSYSILHELATE